MQVNRINKTRCLIFVIEAQRRRGEENKKLLRRLARRKQLQSKQGAYIRLGGAAAATPPNEFSCAVTLTDASRNTLLYNLE